MKNRYGAAVAAAFLLCAAGAAQAQVPSVESGRALPQPGAAAMADIARLYDSLSGRPGGPRGLNDGQVDAALARSGVRPELRREILAAMKQDACRLPGMAPVCRYYGAETIYKVQNLGWAALPGAEAAGAALPARRPGEDLMTLQMRLLEYGAARNLAQRYGDRGLSDAQDAELNGPSPSGARAAKAAELSTRLSVWFACNQDQRTLSGTSPFPITREYRLTTCGTGFGFIFRIAIFGWSWSWELDLLLTHSRFARRVLNLWWLTGADPSICANSIIGWSGNMQCNNYSWTSPVSFNMGTFTNSGPASVVSTGSATKLGQGFGVTIVHQ